MILEIIKYPNKILKTACKPVEFPLKEEINQLCKNMIETCNSHHALGLSAPQVGHNLKIFASPTSLFINPEIKGIGGKIWSKERCLSLPGMCFKIRRYKTISLKFINIYGQLVHGQIMSDIEAFMAQHEMDHLNGILINEKDI